MSEPRTLVVTVGKSLFSSATWRCEGPFEFTGYRKWFAVDGEGKRPFLQSPERRARDSDTLRRMSRILRASPPAELVRFVTLEASDDEPLRYCAELTTLMVMFRESGHGVRSFADFLRGYGSIELICPTHRGDDAHISARHLEQILLAQGAKPTASSGGLVKDILLADSSRRRIRQWGEYLMSLTVRNVDLVVTGGYKGFALLAGDAWARTGSSRGWRVIYLHQDDKTDLLVHEGDGVVARAPGEPPEVLYRRPASRTL